MTRTRTHTHVRARGRHATFHVVTLSPRLHVIMLRFPLAPASNSAHTATKLSTGMPFRNIIALHQILIGNRRADANAAGRDAILEMIL